MPVFVFGLGYTASLARLDVAGESTMSHCHLQQMLERKLPLGQVQSVNCTDCAVQCPVTAGLVLAHEKDEDLFSTRLSLKLNLCVCVCAHVTYTASCFPAGSVTYASRVHSRPNESVSMQYFARFILFKGDEIINSVCIYNYVHIYIYIYRVCPISCNSQ